MARRNFERSTAAIPVVVDFKKGKTIEKPGIPVICSRIHLYREKIGMEQKTLAKAIGVTANAVSNWENGRSRPDVNLLPSICETLHISFYDLFGLSSPATGNTDRDQRLLDGFQQLTKGHKMAVENMIDSLLYAQRMEKRREVRKLLFVDRPLAAGVGDPTEFEEESQPIYVYASDAANQADYVFKVNGESMLPDYHDGDMVFVQSLPIGARLRFGEIGAFMVGNEFYIKKYEKDGLHSLHPNYPVMRFGEEASVYLIGRVLSIMDQKEAASQEDVDHFLELQPD